MTAERRGEEDSSPEEGAGKLAFPWERGLSPSYPAVVICCEIVVLIVITHPPISEKRRGTLFSVPLSTFPREALSQNSRKGFSFSPSAGAISERGRGRRGSRNLGLWSEEEEEEGTHSRGIEDGGGRETVIR